MNTEPTYRIAQVLGASGETGEFPLRNAAPGSSGGGSAVALSDEQLAAIAYKGYDDYWTEDCAGKESEAWAACAKAVIEASGLAAHAGAAAEPAAYLVTNLPSGEPSLCFEDERGDYGNEEHTPVFTPLSALTSAPAEPNPKLDWAARTLRTIADRGRAELGDSYPEIVSVWATLRDMVAPAETPPATGAIDARGEEADEQTPHDIMWTAYEKDLLRARLTVHSSHFNASAPVWFERGYHAALASREEPPAAAGEALAMASGPTLNKKDLNKLLNDFARACTFGDDLLARMAASKAIHEYLDSAFASRAAPQASGDGETKGGV